MSLTHHVQRPDRKIFLCVCYSTAILAPVGWVWFLLTTRNIFQLEQYATGDFTLVLLLALLPMVGNLLAGFSGRRSQHPRWGWLFPAVLFLLTALGWALALGNGWSRWQSARIAQWITDGQFLRLWVSTVVGGLGALVPLVVLLWPEKGVKES